jgi:hypothetical protein
MNYSTANCRSARSGRSTSIPQLGLPIIVLLCLALSGCGHTGKAHGASATTSATPSEGRLGLDADEDNDNPTSAHYDGDDNVVLSYGHAASTTDMRAIDTVIKRYYTAAAAGDGRKGCSLLYSLLVETAPEDLSHTPREGETCVEAMSSFFKRDHSQLKADTVGVGVTRARVKGDSGVVLVRLGSRERRVLVRREGGMWKIDTLLDMGVP